MGREVKQVQVGDWLRIRFSGQIVEVIGADGDSAIVLRADGSHDPFSICRWNLLPLGDSTRQAMNALFADAMRAAPRERS